MKLIIASISLLCMIVVPIQCTVTCDPAGGGNVKSERSGAGTNPLCQNLETQATNMKNAKLCPEKELTALKTAVLTECGDFKSTPSLATEINYLTCTLKQCEGTKDKSRQNEWEALMKNCIAEDTNKNPSQGNHAGRCLTSNPILNCKNQKDTENACKGFEVSVKALKQVCDLTDAEKCKEPFTSPMQLKDCFSKLKCNGRLSSKPLEDVCFKQCYWTDVDANAKLSTDDEKTQTQQEVVACLNQNNCDVAPTTASSTESSTETSTESTTTKGSAQPGPNTASPTANNINPADQGQNGNKPTTAPASIQPQNDNDPTSAGPQDQDVTSDEDEGCMVRANQKIIIAFAATFVAINFLKALPVEN